MYLAFLMQKTEADCRKSEFSDGLGGAEQIAGQMSFEDYQKGGQAGNEQTAEEKEE